MADLRALEITVVVYSAVHDIGMPKCSVDLTQAIVCMLVAPQNPMRL